MKINYKDNYKDELPDGYESVYQLGNPTDTNKWLNVAFYVIGIISLIFFVIYVNPLKNTLKQVFINLFVGLLALVIDRIVHESCHKATVKNLTGLDADVAMIKKDTSENDKLGGRCFLPGYYLTRKTAITCLISPFVLACLVLTCLFSLSIINKWLFLFLLLWCTAGSIADLINALFLFTYCEKTALVEFDVNNTTIYQNNMSKKTDI